MGQSLTEMNRVSLATRLDEMRLAVPRKVRVVGDGDSAVLQWSIDEGWRQSAPLQDCLTAFMRLAEAHDPQPFLRFAERFGVLALQKNGQPGNPNMSPGLPPSLVDNEGTWRVEPLAAWAAYARHARALLLLGGALRRQIAALGPIDAGKVLGDAKALTNVSVEQFPPDMVALPVRYSVNSLVFNLGRVGKQGLTTQKQWLANVLSQYWLAQSNLTPFVRWDGEAPTLDLELTTFMGRSDAEGIWSPFALFSVLAGQLAAAFTNTGRYSQCSECGELFMQSGRRPRLDRARFCSGQCQAAGARRRKREAASRRRDRERASR